MAKVRLQDIIVPTVFSPYVVRRTTELSRLIASGMVARNAQFDELATGPGLTVQMPFWNDLEGASEELSDTGALTPAKITSAQDIATKHFRGKAWASNDLAKYVAGDDPMRVIADLVASFWNRDMQKTILIPTLRGLFTGPLAATHVLNLASENPGNTPADSLLIGSDAVIEAAGRLGDQWERISAMAMHSVPFRRLQKLGLIETERLQDQQIDVNQFLGREVMVDDGMPVTPGATSGFKYTTYLFGNGALALGEGGPAADEATEVDRDILAGDDVLATRRHFVMHARGVAWVGSVAGNSATSAELATATNWSKRYADKDIPLVALVTNG